MKRKGDNMSKLTGVLLFVAGAAIGSVATYFVTKKKIEDRTDAEIKAMKAHYKKKYEEPKEEDEQPADYQEPDFDQDIDIKEDEEQQQITKDIVNGVYEQDEEEVRDYEHELVHNGYMAAVNERQPMKDLDDSEVPDHILTFADPQPIYDDDEWNDYPWYVFYQFKDDQVVDEQRRLVRYIRRTLGDEFRHITAIKGVSYVVDTRMQKVYEVNQYDGTYEDAIADGFCIR